MLLYGENIFLSSSPEIFLNSSSRFTITSELSVFKLMKFLKQKSDACLDLLEEMGLSEIKGWFSLFGDLDSIWGV